MKGLILSGGRGRRLRPLTYARAKVAHVPTERYRSADPDEYGLEPHGTLPYDWSRNDG